MPKHKHYFEKVIKRILIIGPAWIGDMVMAQTLFILLKQHYPTAQLDVLAPKWSEPLLARMPEVSQSYQHDLQHGQWDFAKRFALAKQLEKNQYDLAILLPNSWKSALIPLSANIPIRRGWLGEYRFGLLNDWRILAKDKYPLMIQRFAALAFPPNSTLPENLPRPALQVALPESARQHFQLPNDKPVLVLCPGAEFGPAKRWPEKHYAEVAKAKIKEGWQVWLLGSPKDADVADMIMQLTLSDNCFNLVGKTNLAQAIDLMALADNVVSNDSGLMHIAAALARPLVVLYGSTDPRFTPPLADNVKILSLKLVCSPCFKRICPLEHLRCLWDLLPEQVLAALTELS